RRSGGATGTVSAAAGWIDLTVPVDGSSVVSTGFTASAAFMSSAGLAVSAGAAVSAAFGYTLFGSTFFSSVASAARFRGSAVTVASLAASGVACARRTWAPSVVAVDATLGSGGFGLGTNSLACWNSTGSTL